MGDAGQFRRGTLFLICAVPPHRLRRSSPFEGSFFARILSQFRRKPYGISLIFSTAHMRLIAKSYPGSLTLMEKAWPSSIGGLREAVGGRTSRKDLRLYRRKTVRMITSRNYDYVTREASVKPGILAIDSPLHRLWRSFPRRGAGQFRRGTFFLICAVPPHWLRRSSPFEGSLFAYRFRQFRRKPYGIYFIFSMVQMRLIAKRGPGSLTLSEKAGPPR